MPAIFLPPAMIMYNNWLFGEIITCYYLLFILSCIERGRIDEEMGMEFAIGIPIKVKIFSMSARIRYIGFVMSYEL